MYKYQLHQLRHYVCHLLKLQPGLRDLLPASLAPREGEAPNEWISRLPKQRVLEICREWVFETLETLKAGQPETHPLFYLLAALPGEWDLTDAQALLRATRRMAGGGEVADPARKEVERHLALLTNAGLIIGGRGPERYMTPFPARLILADSEAGHFHLKEEARRAVVDHFVIRAAEEGARSTAIRLSWRLMNYLYAFDLAVEWLEEITETPVSRLLKQSPEGVPPALAAALVEFGQALGSALAQRHSDQSWRLMMGAVVGARICGRKREEADCFRLLGMYFRQTGQLTEAVECLQTARSLYLNQTEPQMACLCSSALGLTLRDIGNPPEALQEFETAWELASEHNLEGEKLSISNCAGDLCLQRGRPAEAREWFLRAWNSIQDAPPSSEQAELCNNLGKTYREENQPDEALRWFSEGLRLGRKQKNRQAQAVSCKEIARLWESRGDAEGAMRWLEQALSLSRDLSDLAGQANTLRELARAARLNQCLSEAYEHAREASQLARRIGDPRLDGLAHMEMAEVSFARREDVAVISALVEAERCFKQGTDTEPLVDVHYRMGLVYFRRREIEDAARHMLSAQALARTARLEGWLEKLASWIQTLANEIPLAQFDSIVEYVTQQLESGKLDIQRPPDSAGLAGIPVEEKQDDDTGALEDWEEPESEDPDEEPDF